MDPIKEAFSKIKEDIQSLRDEITQLRLQQTDIQTHNQTTPTHNMPQIPQQTDIQTHNQAYSAQNHHIQPPYSPNIQSSIGNEGVPTNRQTDIQTHQQTHNYTQNTPNSDFKQANNILSSLDNIKKGIRLKFKRLTPQEMLVFSTLYALEEQNYDEITYRTLATQLKLSESSIRDYINKLSKKGVPIDKIRQNNKTILLQISPDLKNIATLATIQDLREL
ncbi:HTH domain-containing protein [archaeon]|jgi:biotin operon repressor|nr:HTH domain-containing protein [archaeon]